ncbi:MAG: acyltransferase family protein [Rhodococcus sp.]|nr:acyltransferase family protein [Rhodococcus sp. (in: high G+C Gram-positive bacteria)]
MQASAALTRADAARASAHTQAPQSVARVDAPQQKPRYGWVDLAKGVSIVLVVLLHTTNFMVGRGLADPIWHEFNAYAQPIRMPLFFFVSGLFVTSAMSKPWGEVLRRRVAPLVYIYVLWTLLRFLYFTFLPETSGTAEAAYWWKPLEAALRPDSGMWFIYALAVFTVAARALRSVSPPTQLAAAVALAVVSPELEFDSWAWHNMLSYFVFFLLGAYLAPLAHRVATGSTVPRMAAVVAIFAGVSMIFRDSDVLRSYTIATIALSMLGLVTGVLLMGRIGELRVLEPLRWLGRRTLPVFLMHEIVLGTVIAGLLGIGVGLAVGQRIPAGPLVVTAIAVAASVGIHRVVLRARQPWLFTLPDRFLR